MTTSTLNFFKALDQFQANVGHLAQQQGDLLEQKEQLKKSISNSSQFNQKGLNKRSPLAQSIDGLRKSIEKTFKSWDQAVDDALPMKQLAEQYQDRIIFLIFGKVNAGKSSFANFIVSQAGDHQVKRFQFHEGKVKYLKQGEQFKEGFTETTATIQGVEIGKHLVLLDTPGLHSVTSVNGDLTRRFIDSADAVLWLTPSASPGQVQELNDLKAELEKKKPLLPIITRSDFSDEEWCDDAQDIIKSLKNKTPENRALQQNNVTDRLMEFKIGGSVGLKSAKQPLSISIHTFKHDIDTGVSRDLAFERAGLSHLFVQLTALITEAAAYKSNKAKQQMENFLKEHILLSLNQQIQPLVKQAQNSCDSALKKLDFEEKNIAKNALIATEAEVLDLIEKHKSNRDQKKLLKEVNDLVNQQINIELQKSLYDFSEKIDLVTHQLDEQQVKGFSDRTMDFKRVKGLVPQSLAGTGGAVAGTMGGAALGSIVPGVGTLLGGAIGGILGGLAGSAAGSYFVETETITEVIGVGSEELEQSLKEQIAKSVPKTVQTALAQVKGQIQSVQRVCDGLNAEIQKFSKSVAGESHE